MVSFLDENSKLCTNVCAYLQPYLCDAGDDSKIVIVSSSYYIIQAYKKLTHLEMASYKQASLLEDEIEEGRNLF